MSEELALKVARMYADGSTLSKISKELGITKGKVGDLIRTGISILKISQYPEPEISIETSEQSPDAPKSGGKKRADSPRKRAYEFDGESHSPFRRVGYPFDDFLFEDDRELSRKANHVSLEDIIVRKRREREKIKRIYKFLKLAEKGGGGMSLLPMLLNDAKSISGALGVERKMEFNVLRRLCRYQKWGRCWDTNCPCEPDYCPYF